MKILGQNYLKNNIKMKISRIIRTYYYILSARLFGIPHPISIDFRFTNSCNNQCALCDSWKKNKGVWDVDKMIKLIKALPKSVLHITLIGGEPLVEKNLERVINTLRKKDINITVVSNGILVPNRIEDLKKIDYLILSLDGDKKAHERIRGKGNYDKTINAIKTAKKNKINTHMLCVINKYNINCIPEVLNICRENKVKCFFQITAEYYLSSDVNKYLPEKEKYRKTIRMLIREKKRGNKTIINSFSALKYLLTWPKGKKDMKCMAGKLHYHIEPDGKLYPCTSVVNLVKGKSLSNGINNKLFKFKGNNPCRFCWACLYIEFNYALSFKKDAIKTIIDMKK